MKNKRIFSFILALILTMIQMLTVPIKVKAVNSRSFAAGTPELTMKVTDIKGDKPSYTGVNKILTNDNDIKINGDAYVTFNGRGNSTDLKAVKYKFFKQGSQPNERDFNKVEGWKRVDYEEFISSDVIENKSGYLTWRSYDVSHMATLSDTNGKWSSRENVYKSPNNEIQFQSTKTSTTVEEYIPRGQVTKSVFMTNMSIGSSYSRYKEASKFWGYIKPNETGTYYFGISSDDGSYAYIIDEDGEKKELVRRNGTIDRRYPNSGFFYPHGSQWETQNTPIVLKKDHYYPIYLEYFNWGGSADFQLKYRKNRPFQNHSRQLRWYVPGSSRTSEYVDVLDGSDGNTVPQNWFYPSRTDTPGTVPESTFAIDYRAEFPEESGLYYIGVKSGSNEGIYGPFKVSPKAPINLVKEVEKNQFLLNEEFTVNYKIQPQPIPAENIVSESYLKDKEIVLVMDTSGSMDEEIEYNDEDSSQSSDNESIFDDRYAVRNLEVNLSKTGRDYYYEIDFDEPFAGEQVDQTYLVFYSEKEKDEIKNWLENLTWSDIRNIHMNNNGYWNWYEKSFDFPLSRKAKWNWGFTDIDGNQFKGNKSYNVYIATIENSRDQSNCKVIGLTKDGDSVEVKKTKKKIDVMKEVAKNFLGKLKKDTDNRVKVALVPYESYAKDSTFNYEDFADLSDAAQYKSLIDEIDDLNAYGGTNIGDGLRKAYYKFSSPSENTRKYVILMTDGEPTFHSFVEEWKWKYNRWIKEKNLYYGNGNYPNDYKYEGGGNYATENDKLYAKMVARNLIVNGGQEIESFMIAFSNGADKNELKNIADSADGYYKEAVDGNALDDVYQKLAEQIQSDLPIHGINFQESFPQGMSIVDVSEGLEINGQTVTGDIGSISYKLNKETNQFEAEPFKFSINLRADEVGDYTLGRDGNDDSISYIDYKDIDGTDGHKDYPGVSISVYENSPPEVTASLTEKETEKEKYTLTLTINEPAKIEIFNAGGYSIWAEDKRRESVNQYPKTFSIDINKADLSGKYFTIKAEDKSNNETEETVPLINVQSIETDGWSEILKGIKGILNIQTEENSTVTNIKINGAVAAENRLTDSGIYKQVIGLVSGENEIEITVKNQFNNTSTIKIKKIANEKALITNVTRDFQDSIPASSEHDLVYKFHGEKVKYTQEKPAEIVLVLNTSNTMKSYIQGKDNSDSNKGKLLEAAKSFVDNLPDNKNIKVGVVRYYHKGEIVSELQPISNKESIKTSIDGIQSSKLGTNFGDGLRRAYQLLEKGEADANKHLVILSDGFANTGIKELQNGRDWKYVPYVFNLSESINNDIDKGQYKIFPVEDDYSEFMDMYSGDGEEFERRINVGHEYVSGIAKKINKSNLNINSHIIHFKRIDGQGGDKGARANNNEVAGILGITKEIKPGQKFYLAENGQQLIEAFNNVGEAIKDSLPFNRVEYNETFPAGVKLIKYPSGLEKTGTLETGYTLSGHIDNVNMKRSEGNSDLYNVDGEFTIKIKCDKPGIYQFAEEKLVYEDPFKFAGEAPVNGGTIEVTAKKLDALAVLEVQPNGSYELNRNMFSEIVTDINNVELVQIPMNQFIGDIEKINGRYDIVYIGNKIVNGNGYSKRTAKGRHKVNGKWLQYYEENDITDKKAADLLEFIESGQLTVFNISIFENSSLTQTKLYKNFAEERTSLKDAERRFIPKDVQNFKLIDNITTANIKALYDDCSKRPILKITDRPEEYYDASRSGNSKEDKYKYNDSNIMSFIFDLENLNVTEDNPNSMIIKLYLDKNGDGLFKDDEMARQLPARLNGEGYSLIYRFKEAFTGLMPWKVEIIDTVTGVKSYEVGYPAYKGEKLKVRVLQLKPNSNNFRLVNLVPPLVTDDYEIEITEMNVKTFDDSYKNGKQGIKLNGNYDMVIFGFADSYGNGSDLHQQGAIDAIKEFIQTGQSVMFTHDTAGPIDYYKDAPNLTRNLKDVVGFTNYRTYSGSGSGRWDSSWNTTSAYKINNGVITQYPYALNTNLTVASTHQQYWEIDLEDEEVIPWYTLNKGSYKYNPRCYYYTFSKGNVTFSGTGHSSPDGTGNKIDEHQMFINTMIKASRSANHAPTLEVINLEKDKIVSKSQEKFEFSFIAKDIDGDALSGCVYINDIPVIRYNKGDIINNQVVKVVINKGELKKIVKDSEEFTIKIEVEDARGAGVDEEARLKYLHKPVLNMSKDKEQKYLVGDEASVRLQVTTEKTSDKLVTKIQNINYTMTYENLTNIEGIELIGSSEWELSNITFNPNPTPDVQEKEFRFRLNNDGNYTIKNTLRYNYSNFNEEVGTTSDVYSYPISVRTGKIDVKVLNSDATSFGTASITVNKNGQFYTTLNTDSNGGISLENWSSGEYTFSINELNENYIVKGGNSKTINLSYDNAVQTVEFELIDKRNIGLALQSQGGNEYLVGDTANITLTATAYNEDENIDTIIRDIKYSMEYDSNALKFVSTDENWEINNIEVLGSRIPNNKEQTNNLSFEILKAGDNGEAIEYDINNSLQYKYLNNNSGTAGETHKLSVKSGKIKIKVENFDGTAYENISVTVSNKGKTEVIKTGTTDKLGTFSLKDIPSGDYTVSIDIPEGLTAENGNTREFQLSYDKSVQDIRFKLDNNVKIINNGVFLNNKIENHLQVVKSFSADLAFEFKVYDKNPDIRLTLDENIYRAEFKLYKVHSDGSMELAKDNNIVVYSVHNLNSPMNDSVNGVDLSGIAGKKELKIQLPKSSTYENHYILAYKAYQNADVGHKLENTIKINDSANSDIEIEVVKLPILE